MRTSTPITPGLLVLHGNRAELLGETVIEWLARHPLGPLEEEIFLVQSNGVAEWLKMGMASRRGVCAATRVELPARFLWRAYRQVLGREAVPPTSDFDKLPLTWRLMGLLPTLVDQPVFAPLAGFLAAGEGGLARRLQLAERLADLFDQYQVYRADWLDHWAAGHDDAPPVQLPADQLWQPALWRELRAGAAPGSRPELHRRFLAALESGEAPRLPIARRVVLFGMTHVPMQTLEALAALANRCQVLLAVPNPCRFHWADIIEGRELLRIEQRRLPLRKGTDLAGLGLDQMHAHAHPLLAAWGRQGRDFVRQLDAFDDALQARQRFALNKLDLFDEGEGGTLLQQVQERIRDLVPLAEHGPAGALDEADRSIVFHIAHGPVRELEVLHDQLLALLAEPSEGPALKPRDIVVMVPDVDSFAPAIDAVFGQYGHGDPRHIPFDIADRTERGNNPVLVAVEWLLQLPQQRCSFSELRDLLDVPALARRFGLNEADLPRLSNWIAGAGIRWGLDPEHRASLGLQACGDQNSWLFGLRRMLLGYANGGGGALAGIEPYAEVGGLDAGLAGSLADLLDGLNRWRSTLILSASPEAWATRLRELLEAFFEAEEEQDRLTLAALDAGLGAWLQACDTAGFEAEVDLAVAREAWLSQVDEPALNKRFRAGGVTFCTLMPMRSVPFEVVCLLGMNDGDYPRRASRSDFDLMGLPGVARPGDRSRRDDDRQLMLEALLSARRLLYVSWAGRNARDNAEQPPSVLVAQLRDYLSAGWGEAAVRARTQEHPLQPFSRRYFEQGSPLATEAGEWRASHLERESEADQLPPPYESGVALRLEDLVAFLKNPVKAFFRRRLDVSFRDNGVADEDDEPFALDGLEHYQLLGELLEGAVLAAPEGQVLPERQVAAHAERLLRAGALPLAEFGRRNRAALLAEALPMLQCRQAFMRVHPEAAPPAPLRLEAAGLRLDDWLDGVRASAAGEHAWLILSASRVLDKGGKLRVDKLIEPWVRILAASACGATISGVLVARDAMLTLDALAQEQAEPLLIDLITAWREGMDEPLPVAPKTALALLSDGDDKAQLAYEGGPNIAGEVQEPCLARSYPDYEALAADERFSTLASRLYAALQAWADTSVQVTPHQAHEENAGE